MTPVNSDPFCGLYFVSEQKFGELSRMTLRDADGNYYTRFFDGKRWSRPCKANDIDVRLKLRRLYDDLTNDRESWQ